MQITTQHSLLHFFCFFVSLCCERNQSNDYWRLSAFESCVKCPFECSVVRSYGLLLLFPYIPTVFGSELSCSHLIQTHTWKQQHICIKTCRPQHIEKYKLAKMPPYLFVNVEVRQPCHAESRKQKQNTDVWECVRFVSGWENVFTMQLCQRRKNIDDLLNVLFNGCSVKWLPRSGSIYLDDVRCACPNARWRSKHHNCKCCLWRKKWPKRHELIAYEINNQFILIISFI